MPVPTAQLKVFSPLESFPPGERERWRAYVREGGGLTRRQVADVESDVTVARLLGGRSVLGPEAALLRRVGDRTMICPLQLELRAAVALASFRRTVPEAAFDAFLPRGAALDRLDQLSATGSVPHVLDEPWAPALHWFVAFAPTERRFSDHPEGAGPRLRYLTTCSQAADRLEHAIEVVEATVEDGEDVLAALAGMASWLEAFDPVSLLELDYGRVATLFGRDELAADHTADEVWQAIDALESGDLLAAAAAYGVVRARWSNRRAKQHAS